ncbi:hypothetical protein TFLX_00662 [Thermoflexales bacterium]|nr:hypothetical protein TFLX_00662 [Thermoflexales bacterium]
MKRTLKKRLRKDLFSRLTPKAIREFSYQHTENGLQFGFDYHYRSAACFGTERGLVVVEFGILNKTDQSISVRPTDFSFVYDGLPIKSAPVEFDVAASELVHRGQSFTDALDVGPALPHEVLLFLPLLLARPHVWYNLARTARDYLTWRRGKRALRKIRFDYGIVHPGQFKQGLIFLAVEMTPEQSATWPEKCGLNIDVLHQAGGPQVSEKAISISKESSSWLPSLGCIIPALAVQFVCFSGSCYLARQILPQSLPTAPLICGAIYLVIVLLILLALASDERWPRVDL